MCLTCGARARSVAAGEAVRTGADGRQSKPEKGGVGSTRLAAHGACRCGSCAWSRRYGHGRVACGADR